MGKLNFFNEEDLISENDKEKVYLTNNKLILSVDTSPKKYLVAITYKNGNEEEYKRIDYRMDIQCISKNTFKVHNKNFYIDKRKSAHLIEEIAEDVNDIIYPINIVLNSNGSIKEIDNLTEIQQRWENEKLNFKRSYKGDVFNRLIQQINDKIYDNVKLENSLYRNIAFCLLFNKKYISYNEKLTADCDLLFPTDVKTANLTYKGENTIKPYINRYNAIELHYNGEANLLRNNSFQREFPNDELLSEIHVLYDLNVKTKMPSLIKATCKVLTSKRKNIKSIEVLITEEV